MFSNKRILGVGVVVLVLIAGAMILHALWTRYQDMSLDEALAADLPFTLYTLDHARLGVEAPITARYFYLDLGDEYQLETYFFIEHGLPEASPVAVLVSTTLSGLTNEDLLDQTAAIEWAEKDSGYTCAVRVWFERAEVGPADYQSCLYWEANNRHYQFYATWPEADAIRAVNALEAAPTNP